MGGGGAQCYTQGNEVGVGGYTRLHSQGGEGWGVHKVTLTGVHVGVHNRTGSRTFPYVPCPSSSHRVTESADPSDGAFLAVLMRSGGRQ